MYEKRYTLGQFIGECVIFALMLWAFIIALMFL